ncbi:DUF1631 family protein [Thiobacillus sp.]
MNAPSPDALLNEVDARMAQALDNFFQRSRTTIQDAIFRVLAEQVLRPDISTGQTCLDLLNTQPEALSAAFADQFRRHLAQPEMFPRHRGDPTPELRLVDEDTLKRQLAEEKAAAYITDVLRAEILLMFHRIQAVQRAVRKNSEDLNHPDIYGPLAVVRALSRSLDAQNISPDCGTFLLECSRTPLLDTLKHTYIALNQFLRRADIAGPPTHTPRTVPPERGEPDAGHDVLAHIQSASFHIGGETGSTGDEFPASPFQVAQPRRLADRLADWRTLAPAAMSTHDRTSALVLRQLQRDAGHADTGTFDLAVLDALAGLFEFILDDPSISSRYKAEIAHLQIPALRVALVSPDFFSDNQHPARQLIDLIGLFSRRFPEGNTAHYNALDQVHAACTTILADTHPTEAFARAHATLVASLAGENARTETALSTEVARLEQLEQQALGTMLALENLNDLTERHPAPESVLRRLETAWIPHMASLYVAESGEGPGWRTACQTLQNLFLSLQPPYSDASREARLQSIPAINAALRHGLLAQGAEPTQLKDFFSAITTTQECWIRPAMGQREAQVSTLSPPRISQAQIEALAGQSPDTQEIDPAMQQAQQLTEGNWVDFDPPHEGLATARVAWVGAHGHLLFCDSEGEQRFSMDCERLAAAIRAGQARVPEQSLTCNAILRLRASLAARQT